MPHRPLTAAIVCGCFAFATLAPRAAIAPPPSASPARSFGTAGKLAPHAPRREGIDDAQRRRLAAKGKLVARTSP
jgi:hypothetical protein